MGRIAARHLSAPGLIWDMRDWLWHLSLNTGELRKCERRHFTDWQWAQFEHAGLLPGPVQLASDSNYWLYTSVKAGQKWGTFEFRRTRVGVGQFRLSWACICPEPDGESMAWEQALNTFCLSEDAFEVRSSPVIPSGCPWLAAVELSRLAGHERSWMGDFQACYGWYLIEKLAETDRLELSAG